MKLRGQILLGVLLITIIPLALVMQWTRLGVTSRFTELDTRRVEDQMLLTRADLETRSQNLESMLTALASNISSDNQFRLAIGSTIGPAPVNPSPHLDPYLVDFAPRHMSLMNLDFLLVQDHEGKVISSGHFRHSIGQVDLALPRLLGQVKGGQALIPARSATASFLVLARTNRVSLGGQVFHLTGGLSLESNDLRDLSHDDDLDVVVAWNEGLLTTSEDLGRELSAARQTEEIPFILRSRQAIVRTSKWPMIIDSLPAEATLMVTHSQASLRQAIFSLNLRMAIILTLAVIASIFLSILLANRISRPLRQLSEQAEGLDLDRLEADFHSRRRDEVGHLSRLLAEMTQRLRSGVQKLKDAEHRATLGEVARQVNHDIRNGITPLRNVMRHLSEVAENEPQELGAVFSERHGTLEDGLSYLEDLAAHYARLSPDRKTRLINIDTLVTQIISGPSYGEGVKLENRLPVNLPPVEADPISLRRIFDNLLRNALESLPEEGGAIAVSAFVEEDPDLEEMRIQVEIEDTGKGIAPENLDKIFTDFFTTRKDGTGLGLSNVRRLAADCGARISVKSELGIGSTFVLSFPIPDL